MNKVLSESERYLSDFIQSFRFVQYVSELLFDKEDMPDPIKELNNTFEDLYLNNQKKNLDEINRKSFLNKEISFIEKKIEIRKNKENLQKMNLLKMNSIFNIFDNMLYFISNEEIVKNDNLAKMKNNYDFLRSVKIDNILFLKTYFLKFNEKFSNKININDFFASIKDTFNLFLTKIKNIQNKFINYLNKNIDLKENFLTSDKNKIINRKDINNNKLNRRVNNKIDISSSIDYKKEISKFLLNIKTMHVIYKLFNKGNERLNKVIKDSQLYSKKINELHLSIQKQKTSFNSMLSYTQPKDFNSKENLYSRIPNSHHLKKSLKTRFDNNNIINKHSLEPKVEELEYVSKYNSIYINLNITEFDKQVGNLSENNFLIQFKNKWNKIIHVMNNLSNQDLEYRLKLISKLIDSNNFDNFNYKDNSKKEKINYLFNYFDPSKLIIDSEMLDLLSIYSKKLNSIVVSIDEKSSHKINLEIEIKIMENTINEFKSAVNNYLDKNKLITNETDDFDGFTDNKNNLNKNLLITYLDDMNQNLYDLKIVSKQYIKIKENLLELSNSISILFDKNSSIVQLEDLKNKSLLESQKQNNEPIDQSIKLNLEKKNKLVKNSSDLIITTNVTQNITYSESNVDKNQGDFDFKLMIISIITILLLIVIYISIFKKLISYSINYLINSNFKISFLNKNVIFWTLAIVSLLSAVLGKLIYSNWVFLFVSF